MSRFPAELTVTLIDGRTLTECFNQAEMAQVLHRSMQQALAERQSLVLFDGERIEVPAEEVLSVQVVVRDLVEV